MSFYIILRGPAGSGKTTIAEKLAEIYSGHHINIDKVKHNLGLKHSEPEKLEANKKVIKDTMTYLEQGKIVILDEVLYYEKQLKQLEELPYEHYIFSLQVPLEVCLERNIERRKTGLRKTRDEDIKLVYNWVSKIKKGIEISTYQRTIEESVNEIISYLPE